MPFLWNGDMAMDFFYKDFAPLERFVSSLSNYLETRPEASPFISVSTSLTVTRFASP
jgi:hypothetical protein